MLLRCSISSVMIMNTMIKGKKIGLYKDSFVTKVFAVEIEITAKKVNKMLGHFQGGDFLDISNY